MKRRFVLCQTSHITGFVLELREEHDTPENFIPDTWIQLSEEFEAEVVDRPKDVVIAAQIKVIDSEERALRGKFQHELDKLAERKASLLSISHNVAGE